MRWLLLGLMSIWDIRREFAHDKFLKEIDDGIFANPDEHTFEHQACSTIVVWTVKIGNTT